MTARLLFAVAFAALAGCGSGTPEPDTARPLDDSTAAPDLPPIDGPRPAASEPAAATLVNAVLLAHTASETSRVDKLRKVFVKRRGLFQKGGAQSNASMDVYLWGDHYRANLALEAEANVPYTFSVKGATGWMLMPQLGPTPLPITPTNQESVLPDIRGDRLLFLGPLADPHLTAETARAAKAGGDTTLRLWAGDVPPVLLVVEAKTNRLKRVHYEAKENGQTIARSLELYDLEPVAGVLLPKRVHFAINGVSLTTWTKIEYEVPGLFEPAVFDKP